MTNASNVLSFAVQTAIRDAYRDGRTIPVGEDREEYLVERIHRAVMKAVAAATPTIINEAMETPAVATAMINSLLIPTLRTLEDEINDEHDKPNTPDSHRPGLRAASRMIRNTRRAAEEETAK